MGAGGDAEVACLISTAWMETYTRVFLPTVGTPVRFDANEKWSTLQMDGSSTRQRNEVREELEESIANFEDVEVDFSRMDPSRDTLDGPGSEEYDKIEEERERKIRNAFNKCGFKQEETLEGFLEKFDQARKDGVLN